MTGAAGTAVEAKSRGRRFARDERGVSAVEFGIVAMPFLALLCAIIETALIFFANQVMDSAVADTARLIRTGQAQQQSFTKAKFKTELCARFAAMIPCDESLHIDVRKYTNFAEANLATPIQDGELTTDFQYDHGKAGEIVVVRAYYEWPLFFNKMGFQLDNLSNGNHLIGSVTAFRNEPFPW